MKTNKAITTGLILLMGASLAACSTDKSSTNSASSSSISSKVTKVTSQQNAAGLAKVINEYKPSFKLYYSSPQIQLVLAPKDMKDQQLPAPSSATTLYEFGKSHHLNDAQVASFSGLFPDGINYYKQIASLMGKQADTAHPFSSISVTMDQASSRAPKKEEGSEYQITSKYTVHYTMADGHVGSFSHSETTHVQPDNTHDYQKEL